MAKAGEKPKPKTKKLSQKEQVERFKQTARELGCDESEGALDRAFERITPSHGEARSNQPKSS
jgi:hypothetical protein